MASVFKAKGAAKYTIFYTDENGKRRKKAGMTDKAMTQRLANKLENDAAARREGLIDPRDEGYRDAAAKPVAEHLAEWTKAIVDKGNTQSHVDLITGRARRVIAMIGGAKLSEVEFKPAYGPDRIVSVQATLEKFIGPVRLRDLTEERVQAALSAILADGRSHGTCN